MASRSTTATTTSTTLPPVPQRAPDSFTPRSKPWLLPSNRKLRNLLSISLRNLSPTPPSPLGHRQRHRGKTIDDDAVPQTLTSPAKLVALREQSRLEHSRSSSDLRSTLKAVDEDALTFDQDREGSGGGGVGVGGGGGGIGGGSRSVQVSDVANGSPKAKTRANAVTVTPRRPMLSKTRRRSTLEWVNATPQRRQERLENVTAERMADVFFSLHIEATAEPVYVSETIERTMNPTFRHIDWSLCGPGITRLHRLTLRFWTKRVRSTDWKQLLEVSASLPRLQYLGKSLDQLQHTLPENCVVFHLSDGIYTSYTSFADYIPPPTAPLPRGTGTRPLPTASFDALLRLSKLDDSIQDALVTRNNIADDLEHLLQANQAALIDRDRVPEAEDRLKTIQYAKKTVEKQLLKARKQQDEKRASLQSRRDLMQTDLEHRKIQAEDINQQLPALTPFRDDHAVKEIAIASQRRRIVTDLATIYPLNPHPKKSLAFTIRSLYLPDANDIDSTSPEKAAAALGHTAQVLMLLSHYLRLPLPYPVTPRGSTSTIHDPLSLLKTQASTTQKYIDETALRTYPLFSLGVPRFRFEYAVFLLGKDIQILVEQGYGGRVVDVRQLLPNLTYLFFVATAGEGEMPARKAGGVRGLLRVGGRRGSEASGTSTFSLGVGGNGKEGGGMGVGGGVGKVGAVESLRRSAAGRTKG
ncbi:hypothetical protein LTR62_000150 [Meristemomyces frigidus]|uniref:Autophagy-related protein 14 n=1 Tax=Meristemomyces frigidus TaxID=1508187 RepID=A0AAN7TS44_9PEZI|nr:hypothetical protein LTR62_000150 [Meristemomyces frigidus]